MAEATTRAVKKPGAAWLVVALFLQAVRRVDVTLAGKVALIAGLALAAILVHSLFYNDFFEDPTTWLLIGLVAFGQRPSVAAEQETVAA